MRRFFALLCVLLVLGIAVPVLASPPDSPAAQTFDCTSVTQIPFHECQALMALYDSTNGPGWTNHTGWATTNTPCSWYGVSCSGGQVTQLSLSNNQLSGSLPSQLGDFSQLTYLYLNNNQLSGSIPALYFDVSLQKIDLSNNQLSGGIPSQLDTLFGLQELYLQNNQLSGSIPPQLGSSINLYILDLSNNQLSGGIPSNLTGLWSLDLSNNRLSGSIPSQLGNGFLGKLDLSNNQLSGTIPAALVNLTNLTEMDLGYNRLTASDPTLLTFLAAKDPDWMNTQTLPPGNVQVNGRIFTWTPILYTGDGGHYVISFAETQGGPYTLVTQVLGKNASSYDTGGLNLAYNTTYYFVVQSYTPAHGEQQNNLLSDYSQEIPVTIGSPPSTDCNSVTEIPVSECQALLAFYNSTNGPGWHYRNGWAMTNTPCKWYGVSCREGHVVEINRNYCRLSGSLPPEIGNLTHLGTLMLWDNQLSGSIPPEIGNLTHLNTLWLNKNQLSGSIPPEIGSMTRLMSLDLSGNQLSGSIPPEIGNLTNLLALYLNDNQLSGSILPGIGNLSDLTSLGLGSNHFSGSIPPELGNLTNVIAFDVSNNQLSGDIPSELGNLTNLGAFNLSNNQLSGDIPTSLANLTGLVSYETDLSYNRLTASDPTLLAFLATKDPDWAATQTVTPTNVHLTGTTLTWTPIVYTGDGGYYIISYLNPDNGAYTVVGQTADKLATSYPLSGLSNSTTYYFAVQSYTPAHGGQQNSLTSGYSQMRDAILSAANAGPKPAYYEVNPPLLTWNALSWAAGYEVQVATDKTFPPAAMVYTKADLPASVLSVSAAVTRNGMYYWRVRALRANGSAGAWSAVESFMVDAP